MDLTLWRDYLKQLERLADTLDKLTEVEREKARAVGRGDLNTVDACMKREQAFSLNLRGFDQKREKMLAQMGISGTTLRQLEDHAPPEAVPETKRTVEKVLQRYQVFQSASEVARTALECNLHEIDKLQLLKELNNEITPEARQADFRA